MPLEGSAVHETFLGPLSSLVRHSFFIADSDWYGFYRELNPDPRRHISKHSNAVYFEEGIFGVGTDVEL